MVVVHKFDCNKEGVSDNCKIVVVNTLLQSDRITRRLKLYVTSLMDDLKGSFNNDGTLLRWVTSKMNDP